MSNGFSLDEACRSRYGTPLTHCSDAQIYTLLADVAAQGSEARRGEAAPWEGRRLYYLCAEFLLGRLLSDRLRALGVYESIREQLYAAGKSPALVEEQEREPSLGNGGLGRLAACFLDSAAHLSLPVDGVGLLYHLGLFRQRFDNLQQRELPDPWLQTSVLFRRTDFSVTVRCAGQMLRAQMYDLDVISEGGSCNTLHLFDVESVEDRAVGERESIGFDMTDIARHLTLFLYPDDSTHQGRLLRLCQQYFLAVCAAALIVTECRERGWRAGKCSLGEYAVVQINDTHPALIIPALILRLREEGLSESEAIEEVQALCAYTNHTVMSEALERWSLADVEAVAPELMPLIARLDAIARARARTAGIAENSVALICDGQLAMAHMAVHFSSHVNGVAALHSALLKRAVLPSLAELYPERFSNKTNGITHRRWLLGCNRPLSRYLTRRIGENFVRDASHLEKLEAYLHDDTAKTELLQIKAGNKARLSDYLQRTQGVSLLCEGIFDVQVKRLHEYKRQHLNALYLIDKIDALRRGERMTYPLVAIFGAKAAPSYQMAKDILHLLLCLQALTAGDPACAGQLQIVVVENYNVSAAEYIMPAAEISEQISLASKEASGTGNMKMMMNGALTLGTADGANIEIMQRVGQENMYLFGMSGEEVVALERGGSYRPSAYYENDDHLRRAVDFLLSEELLALGDRERLTRLHDTLLQYDSFMSFADFASYRACRDRALTEYVDRSRWAEKMMLNISRSGYFSSDRTILEYNRDIWHLPSFAKEKGE